MVWQLFQTKSLGFEHSSLGRFPQTVRSFISLSKQQYALYLSIGTKRDIQFSKHGAFGGWRLTAQETGVQPDASYEGTPKGLEGIFYFLNQPPEKMVTYTWLSRKTFTKNFNERICWILH